MASSGNVPGARVFRCSSHPRRAPPEADAGTAPAADVPLSSRDLRLAADALPAFAFREVDVV